MDKKSEIQPVFIVGHPRSGTTLVATLIGRHSNISMPAETQFFPEIYDDRVTNGYELAKSALENHRVRDLGLEEDKFLSDFSATSMTYKELFELIIRSYCEKVGKKRPGEKSPNHLRWADVLLNWFPNAKVIIVVRDGRDVVNSLMDVPWSHSNIIKHSFDWVGSQVIAYRLHRNYGTNVFLTRYESLLSSPERVLNEVCDFLSESYEPQMLSSGGSDAVPSWEAEWKGKAKLNVDPSNIGKWVKRSYINRVVMNTLMGEQLKRSGYIVPRPGLLLAAAVWCVSWPYHPKVRPIFSGVKSLIFRRQT